MPCCQNHTHQIGPILSPQEITVVFQAQTKNVRELEKAWSSINRTINEALRTDDIHLATFQTKMLGLVFCAYAEATFSKLIHTPYGLTGINIAQIKYEAKQDIVRGWQKCLVLSTKKIQSNKSNHVPNIVKKISLLINSYIKEPSLIRNKIAHGQWNTALNQKNTAINQETTDKITNLTIVDLYRYKLSFEKLSVIFEDIIESPNKAHWKFYWNHVTEYEQLQIKMAQWTLQKKIDQLKKKDGFYKIK